MRCGRKLNLTNVDSEHLEDAMLEKDPAKYHKAWETLSKSQGVSRSPLTLLWFLRLTRTPAARARRIWR